MQTESKLNAFGRVGGGRARIVRDRDVPTRLRGGASPRRRRRRERFTSTPNVGVGMSDGGARDWRIGWRLTSAVPDDSGFELSLDALRHEAAGGATPPDHGLMLRGAMRW